MKQGRTETWVMGHLALALLAVNPAGLGGVHLRARASPVRDAFLSSAPALLHPFIRLAPTLPDEALFGGMDIAESLAKGRVVQKQGLLSAHGTKVVTMAERLRPNRAAQLARHLDHHPGDAFILLDEGIDDEAAPAALTERLAFCIDLDGLRMVELAELALGAEEILEARERLARIAAADDAIAALTVTAARYGITSMRAPLLAMAAARANAALNQRKALHDADLRLGAELVFAHRATQMPEETQDTPEPPCPEDQPEPETQDRPDQPNDVIPDEMLIEAVRAILPDGAIQALADKAKARGASKGSGSGRRRRSNRRGRPLPSIAGMPSSDARIDLVATLRAAAPWQAMRRSADPERKGLILQRSDFRVKVYEERSDRLIIFVVDASGSAAMTRLAEAKGAVEHLLADAYSSRDHVALLAFRGDTADAILPPTRALVQAKRALGGLPGGGGTPLAAGLKAAAETARQAQQQGLSPSYVLLTDGRANVGLAEVGRDPGQADAARMAGVLGQMGLPGLVLDTNRRPKDDLAQLAALMGAQYLALPRADAQSISTTVTHALRA